MLLVNQEKLLNDLCIELAWRFNYVQKENSSRADFRSHLLSTAHKIIEIYDLSSYSEYLHEVVNSFFNQYTIAQHEACSSVFSTWPQNLTFTEFMDWLISLQGTFIPGLAFNRKEHEFLDRDKLVELINKEVERFEIIIKNAGGDPKAKLFKMREQKNGAQAG